MVCYAKCRHDNPNCRRGVPYQINKFRVGQPLRFSCVVKCKTCLGQLEAAAEEPVPVVVKPALQKYQHFPQTVVVEQPIVVLEVARILNEGLLVVSN
ncbi:hypothetical protein PVAND_003675 [Polypedilum vanderplanki]|uniref:Uncharacterized protein n=1 Tax=Polypedilum vanderplanki TaxID=319348 RepID=A0A9J6BUS3_POLVA|nr:hypothetical protein PVAND_003675 [Polypedilum vanderplanki]